MELENIASLKPGPDYEYFFNVGLASGTFESQLNFRYFV